MLLIVNFFMCLIMSVLLYISIVKLSDLKFNKSKAICYITCVSLLVAFVRSYEYYIHVISVFKILSNFLVIILATYYILIKNMWRSFYYTIFIYTIVLINDSIISLIMIKLLKYSLGILHNNIIYMTLVNLMIASLTYVEIILLKAIWDRKRMTDRINKNTAYILFALMTFIVTAANILIYSKYIEMIDNRFILMNIFITSTYFILTMSVHRVYSNLAINEQENKQLRIYKDMADELIDEYRRVRHNTHNIIQAAEGFIEANDMEGLKEHFSGVIERQNSINKSSISSLYKIVHPGIKSLLSSKLGKIESKSLNLSLEITTDLKGVRANISDMCEVLGVFLDNSIEAAELTEKKNVEICIFEDHNCYEIIIRNSYDKEKDKKGNGIGLKTVKSILKKYNHMLNNTIIEEKYYTQELIIKR